MSNAIGLCMKAGRCRSGDFVSEKLVRAGEARLVLLDQRAADATRERYRHLCQRENVPLILVPEMGEAIGKPERIVAVVTDQGFATMIQGAVAQDAAARDAQASKTNDRGHEQNGK